MVNEVFSLKDVSFRYEDGIRALDKVTFKVLEGESLVVIGPNGAGKTTLLHIMAGLEAGYEGHVLYKGEDLKSVLRDKAKEYEFRREVQIVLQDPSVQLFRLSVRRDIAFGPEHLGMSSDEVDIVVDEVLKYLGIEHLAERHPYTLSYGERRLAAIASALALKPRVLLLDEPTADLDLNYRERVICIIKELKDRGTTLITATHDVLLAREAGDSAILLNRHVKAMGTPEEILSNKELLRANGLAWPERVECH
jgi:cobalt/nickel transport system ATP-binding protein